METIINRWWITVIACSAFAASALAQSARTASIDGVYNGSYAGGQDAPARGQVGQVANSRVGPTKFKLAITQQDNGVLAGVFTLYLPEGSATKAYTCDLTGYIHANRTFLLNRGKWETPPPSGFEMQAGLNGQFDPAGGNGAGQIAGKLRDDPRPKFQAIRDADESATLASAHADKKDAATPATPVAPPASRPTAAQPAELTAIDGVYHGSYTSEQGPTKLTLTLTTQPDGTLAGVFTLYLPAGSATTAYTCRLDGRYIPGRAFGLARPKWETAPPQNLNILVINGTFDAAGGQGAGKILGKSLPSNSVYELTRDMAKSASMPTVIAAKQAAKAFTPAVINGVYTGEYRRTDGNGKLKISIKSTDDGSLTALFTFELLGKPGSFITYKLTGKYDAKATTYGVGSSPFQFTTIEPLGKAAQDALDTSKANAGHVGITGPGSINGSITGLNPQGREFSCGWITATKDRTASADLDKAMLAQAAAATAPAAPMVRLPFEGIYNGSYADKQGPIKFKLALWVPRASDGTLLNAEIAGLLTVFATGASGTMPYTSEVYGPSDYPRYIDVHTLGWEPPLSGVTLIAGLEGKFDPGSGGKDALRISGYRPKFEAIRDATESANMDFERLRNHVYPGIVGVFNGTYTRANEPPTKFKLSITHNGDGPMGLAGMATIYLPTDSGAKPYTYDLKGVETYTRTFELGVNDWVTTSPKDFKDFRAMGFNGKVVLDVNQNTARIISVPESAPNVGSNSGTNNAGSKRHATHVTYFVPTFEAAWDAAESADIKGTIAAQRAVGDADLAAALKAHAEVVKNAKPKQLASKYLVRKSQAYWDGFRSDFIREIFDGGFASDVDNDSAFQSLFIDYVDLFSKDCAAYLPADHQTITITTTTTRGGAVIDTTYKTVEIDSRFIPKYVEYSGVEPAPGSEQEKQQTAKTIAIAGQIFHAGGPSHGVGYADAKAALHLMAAHGLFGGTGMNKFFATEVKATGPSAALRQMGENLLRAINGEPSLQQAGGKIDGAEAETDKNLPPGRFAHLVDAAHAFYRDPANARLEGRFETAFDETLAAKYRGVMTPEEEYYYANDFEGRFRNQIMQPRDRCTDPAWVRLHPAVEQCVEELGQ